MHIGYQKNKDKIKTTAFAGPNRGSTSPQKTTRRIYISNAGGWTSPGPSGNILQHLGPKQISSSRVQQLQQIHLPMCPPYHQVTFDNDKPSSSSLIKIVLHTIISFSEIRTVLKAKKTLFAF